MVLHLYNRITVGRLVERPELQCINFNVGHLAARLHFLGNNCGSSSGLFENTGTYQLH